MARKTKKVRRAVKKLSRSGKKAAKRIWKKVTRIGTGSTGPRKPSKKS